MLRAQKFSVWAEQWKTTTRTTYKKLTEQLLLWSVQLFATHPACPSPLPGVCSNSWPLSWWYHPTISPCVIPFSSCPQSFPASGSFPMSRQFTSDQYRDSKCVSHWQHHWMHDESYRHPPQKNTQPCTHSAHRHTPNTRQTISRGSWIPWCPAVDLL